MSKHTSSRSLKRLTGLCLGAFALSILALTPKAAWANSADSLLVSMDWQETRRGGVLSLTFDREPLPGYDQAYDLPLQEARFTFWKTACNLPATLRTVRPQARDIAGIQAKPLLFGEGEETTQIIVQLNRSLEFEILPVGSTLQIVFGEEATKGDAVTTISSDDPAFGSLAGLVTMDELERDPILLAQNDSVGMEDSLPVIEESGSLESDDLDGAVGSVDDSYDEDLPDMSDILGEAFDVPDEQQDIYIPEPGDARLRYDFLGTETAVMDEELWNKRLEALKFRETPLQDALRLIAARSGLNILFNSNDVQGEITTELKDVPLGAALEAILRVNGLAAVRTEGNIVRIVPRSEVYSDEIELSIRSRPLNWVKAEHLAQILQDFVSDDGSIVASGDANALVIKDSPANLAQIMELIDRLDVPEKQVTIEVMALDFNVTMAREQGIDWTVARPDSQSINYVNATDFSGRPVAEDETQQLFGEFFQTLADNTIEEDGTITLAPVGMLQQGLGLTSLPIDTDVLGVRANRTNDTAIGWEWGTDISVLGQRFNLEAAISALETQNIVSVLANPEVTTLNNIEAVIRIVRKTPFFETIQIPGSNNVSTTVKFEDIGLTLNTTPNITNNNFVRLLIETEQKIFVNQVSSTTGATGITVDERNFTSNVVVKDENTVVLGGLRQLNTNNNELGSPWFRRAPVLGWLFKNLARTQDKKELMLFVTPEILKDPRLTEFEEARLDTLDMMWSLPDYFFDDASIVPDDFYSGN